MSGGRDGSAYSCAEVEEVAAELGLGVLGGVERAQALAHIEGCSRCQALVEEMAGVSDALLALSPEVEPPAGFEGRLVARRQEHVPPSGHRRRWPVAAAAVVAAAAAAAVAVAVGLPGSPTGFQVQHPGVVAAMGGRDLVVTKLLHHGHAVGQVFVYAGDPSWIFMTVEAGGPARRVNCQLDLGHGRTADIGSFTVADGYRSWGSTVNVEPSKIVGVRLVTQGGTVLAEATL